MENTQLSSNQEPTKPFVQQQADQNNNKLFTIIAISILLTGLITGSIVYFWQKSANEKVVSSLEQKVSSLKKQASTVRDLEIQPQSSSPSGSSLTTTSSSGLEETASWKTYTNLAMGISFRYPDKTIEVLECEGGYVYIAPLGRHADPCRSDIGMFYITTEEPDFKLSEWYYKEYNITTESINFSSRSATKYSGIRVSSESSPLPQAFYIISIPMGTKTILVDVDYYPGTNTLTLDDNLIDQVLTTFKFISQ